MKSTVSMKRDIAALNYRCKLYLYVLSTLHLLIIMSFIGHEDGVVSPMRFRPIGVPFNQGLWASISPWFNDYVLAENATLVQVEKHEGGCKLPRNGYKAWRKGVLTAMKPEIRRNCSLLFRGDKKEVQRVRKENSVWNSVQFDRDFYDMALDTDCSKIRSEFMDNMYVTKEELEFPIAFSFNVHENPQQIFRFLKVIYRPHNLYCLQYDQKSNALLKTSINNLARCLGNVLIPRKSVNIVWGCSTIMEAQMNCITELYNARSSSYPWRYIITLCGKELPLRTNREIVNILKKQNGKPGINIYPLTRMELNERFTHKFTIGSDNRCHGTSTKLGPVPYGIELKKSMAYFSLTPEFVDFLLHNKTSQDLYEYMKGASNAEEHYFSTVYSLRGAPTDMEASLSKVYKKNTNQVELTSTVSDCVWNFHGAKCSSWIIHYMCVISSADLYQLKYQVDLNDVQGPLFHNKYFMERDHTVMDCLEEQLVIRNKQEYIRECGSAYIRNKQL